MMRVYCQYFGTTKDGEIVNEYALENENGMKIQVINYGCAIRTCYVKDSSGNPIDVVLGYDDLSSYEENKANLGVFVGRVANRIKDSRFTLNNHVYELPVNNGKNHLHGCLSHKIFSTVVADNGVRFTYKSPYGEEGFPGNVEITVEYQLTQDNQLILSYDAVSDQDTILNLTNHSFFNLSGHGSGTIDVQELEINADTFLECDSEICPTGVICNVEGTPMDFRKMHAIGQQIHEKAPQLNIVGGGYDHCFCLAKHVRMAARAYSPQTGILLEIATTQPGIQFYSGNFLNCKGKGHTMYTKHCGFALETEHYPCATSFPSFPSILLKKGEHYREQTIWNFSVI